MHYPAASLALCPHQERQRRHLVEIFDCLGVIGEHTSYATFTHIGSHAVVDAVVHRHCVSHLLRQSTLEVYMIVDDREIALLQPDYLIGRLVNRRECVGRIDSARLERSHCEIAQHHRPLVATQGETPRRENAPFVFLGAVRLLRLGVAHHIDAVYRNGDIAGAHCDLKVKPCRVRGHRLVEIAHSRQRARHAAPVHRAVMQQHLISRVVTHVKPQRCLSVSLSISLAGQDKIRVAVGRQQFASGAQRHHPILKRSISYLLPLHFLGHVISRAAGDHYGKQCCHADSASCD